MYCDFWRASPNQFSSITFLSFRPVANKIKASSSHRILLPSTPNAQHLHQEGVDRVKCFAFPPKSS
ncbi:uncharacterized protein EAE98_006799 [Botrytis deweyae]|uniref:Uncharacterized protein n=1 Tax=Botrytis deweyae TaxID=2478750 RepID=A0ABQ7IIQ9_9HELO|nr:uncharacterized protein EAE98_006799 [Botrytis deweyae]KAF7925574.1 hypothetical protein EAE98_006799 [Botrytis deweyae]